MEEFVRSRFFFQYAVAVVMSQYVLFLPFCWILNGIFNCLMNLFVSLDKDFGGLNFPNKICWDSSEVAVCPI